MANEATAKTFNNHILETFPDLRLGDIRKLRNQYWTPMKHSGDLKGAPFDLSDKLAGFEDHTNDHMLFVVWHDYSAAGFSLPLEVQCFQVWYYGMYPENLSSKDGFNKSLKLFGPLDALSRAKQKQKLKDCIAAHSGDIEIFQSLKTDPRRLVLR